MKKIAHLLFCVSMLLSLTSCGSFLEGLAIGMSSLSSSLSYSDMYTSCPATTPLVSAVSYDTGSYGSTSYASTTSYDNSSSYDSGSSSYDDSSSSSYSSKRQCLKMMASDNAHCNGSGVCSRCNGKGHYYDNTFGLNKLVDPCVTCGGSGKCPSCGGTGYR